MWMSFSQQTKQWGPTGLKKELCTWHSGIVSFLTKVSRLCVQRQIAGKAANILLSAHYIQTRSSQTFHAACGMKGRYRWCLTGTPIHNSLDDYGALLSFVEVQPFADKAVFDFWITEPIKQNRLDSLRRREKVVRATCLRRTKSLNSILFKMPLRSDKVEMVDLSPEDRELYKFFELRIAQVISELSRRQPKAGKTGQRNENSTLAVINFLRLICDHGEHLLPSSALEAWKTGKGELIDWQMMRTIEARCDICRVYVNEHKASVSMNLKYQCQHSICLACVTSSQKDKEDEGSTCPKCSKQTVSETESLFSPFPRPFIRPSAKVEKLIHNLRQEQDSGKKR